MFDTENGKVMATQRTQPHSSTPTTA